MIKIKGCTHIFSKTFQIFFFNNTEKVNFETQFMKTKIFSIPLWKHAK